MSKCLPMMSQSAMSIALRAPMTAEPRKWEKRYMYCQWCSMRSGIFADEVAAELFDGGF